VKHELCIDWQDPVADGAFQILRAASQHRFTQAVWEHVAVFFGETALNQTLRTVV
jgi:hypothetical protein